MNFFYIIPLYLAGLSFVGCPPAGKAFDPQEGPEETEAEIADLKEEIHELKEEVEEIKDDVEVLQLKDDVRDIRDDVAEMKEDMQDLREEKDDTKHKHFNPYKFFNKIQKDTEEARKERIEEKVDKINPLKMRKIVKFCILCPIFAFTHYENGHLGTWVPIHIANLIATVLSSATSGPYLLAC